MKSAATTRRLLSVNERFPQMIVDNGTGNIMVKNYGWIRDVLQDIEDFCIQNELGISAGEIAKVRPKIDDEIRVHENEQASVTSLRERKVTAH